MSRLSMQQSNPAPSGRLPERQSDGARKNETSEIKALLQARIDHLVRELAPGGSQAGKYYLAKNPVRADKHAGSFWVATKGHAIGAWRDEASGDKGDVFKLICYCRGLDFKQAIAWARGWLNYEQLPADAVRLARSTIAREQSDDRQRDARDLEENRKRALGLWLKADAKLDGSITERYLDHRGIVLGALARPPGCIRHFSAHKHSESGQLLPCMAVMMTSTVTNQAQAVHRTWLALDGSAKADVMPARKIWPSFKGSVMRLARGETELSVDDAVARGKVDRLALCEGVEDGLSIAVACPDLRVWSVGVLGNLQHVRIPDCCAEVIVCADNDWGKPQAEAQLRRGLEALAAQRRPVRIARSSVGKDANDALRG